MLRRSALFLFVLGLGCSSSSTTPVAATDSGVVVDTGVPPVDAPSTDVATDSGVVTCGAPPHVHVEGRFSIFSSTGTKGATDTTITTDLCPGVRMRSKGDLFAVNVTKGVPFFARAEDPNSIPALIGEFKYDMDSADPKGALGLYSKDFLGFLPDLATKGYVIVVVQTTVLPGVSAPCDATEGMTFSIPDAPGATYDFRDGKGTHVDGATEMPKDGALIVTDVPMGKPFTIEPKKKGCVVKPGPVYTGRLQAAAGAITVAEYLLYPP